MQEICQNTENQFKEERGQHTITYYPNEICDLVSQNNIAADPRNRNKETDSEMR